MPIYFMHARFLTRVLPSEGGASINALSIRPTCAHMHARVGMHTCTLKHAHRQGPPTAHFRDLTPVAFRRRLIRGVLPDLKIVCSGSRGIRAGQKVTIKYEQWGGMSGVAHPHRSAARSTPPAAAPSTTG